MKPARLNTLDIEELACKITGLDYDEIDADTSIIDKNLYEKFEITIDQFADIVSHLIPLIDVGKSELTGKRYKGFADTEKQIWLTKIEVK